MNFFASMEFEIADSQSTIEIEDSQIISAIQSLSPLEQKIFEYYFLDSKSCNKIAKLLNKSHHLISKNIKIIQKKMKLLLIEE